MESYVSREELYSVSVVDYETRSDVEKLVEGTIETAVEIATRRVVTEIEEATIDHVLTEGFDEIMEGMKTPVRIMMQGESIEIFYGDLATIMVYKVDALTEATRSWTLPLGVSKRIWSIGRQLRHFLRRVLTEY